MAAPADARHMEEESVRGREALNPWRHIVAPLIGGGIIIYVMIKADVAAKTVGLIWLGVGIVLVVGLYLAGGRRPELSALQEP